MPRSVVLIIFLLLALSCMGQQLYDHGYDILNIPDLRGRDNGDEIVIAVLDDGFLLSHKELKPFIWRNDGEIPNNKIDDDGNGYIDDIYGWDMSDSDPDVIPKEGMQGDYFHGTMIASIIVRVASTSFGESAHERIRIMPVKVLSDFASRLTMEQGYSGIQYALDNEADIICMAWNGGTPSQEDMALVNRAYASGIFLLASSGNEATTDIAPPAGLDMVCSVGAHDSVYVKLPLSNYGTQLDLMATGDAVSAAHPQAENAYFNGYGTSAAVALATGAVAVLKSTTPSAHNQEILHSLINSAKPVDAYNPYLYAEVGAGTIDLSGAFECLQNSTANNACMGERRILGAASLNKQNTSSVLEFNESTKEILLKFMPDYGRASKCSVTIASATGETDSYAIQELPGQLRIPGNELKIDLSRCGKRDMLTFEYRAIPIDSTRLYCQELVELKLDSGVITDGSGTELYAGDSSCKWLLNGPPGTHWRLDFIELDTEDNVDHIWLFHGSAPLQDNLIAKFSGSELPPIIVTDHNELLIWFLSDRATNRQGWTLSYSKTTMPAGVYSRESN